MPRADQSLTRPSPKMCLPARAIGTGSPCRLPGPIHTANSSSSIELAAGAEARLGPARFRALAVRAPHRHVRLAHRGRPAVIGDRNVFVIGIERIIRIAPHAAVSRVVDTGEEIGEITDLGRADAASNRPRDAAPFRSWSGRAAAVREQFEEAAAQRRGAAPRPAPSAD